MKNGIHFHLGRAGRFWPRVGLGIILWSLRLTTSVVEELGLKSFSQHSLRFWVNSRMNAYYVIDGAPLFFHSLLEFLAIGSTKHPSIKAIPVGAIKSDIMFSADEWASLVTSNLLVKWFVGRAKNKVKVGEIWPQTHVLDQESPPKSTPPPHVMTYLPTCDETFVHSSIHTSKMAEVFSLFLYPLVHQIKVRGTLSSTSLYFVSSRWSSKRCFLPFHLLQCINDWEGFRRITSMVQNPDRQHVPIHSDSSSFQIQRNLPTTGARGPPPSSLDPLSSLTIYSLPNVV